MDVDVAVRVRIDVVQMGVVGGAVGQCFDEQRHIEQRHIEALMKTFKVRKHMDEGLFLRELAIYLESQGDILQAFKHMAKAKEFRPHGDIINRKLIEYAKHICQTSF